MNRAHTRNTKGQSEDNSRTSWQRNLAVNFAAELLTMTAFSFVNPLFPLYIQKAGGFTTQQAAFWAGIAASGLAIAMFLISPVWGLVADRFGRKVMVLRSMFGGCVVLSLMGLTSNVYIIIALRCMQGLATGTMAAMIALTSSIVPRNRIPFATGIIMLSVFSGQSIGPLAGGFIADHLGYDAAFYASGLFLFLGGLTVLLFVKEDFDRSTQGHKMSMRGMLRLAGSKQMLSLLAVLSLFAIAQSTVAPIISLRIKELVPNGDAATVAGVTFSLIGVAAAISSLVGARLSGRFSLKTILVGASIAMGLLYLPPVWAGSATLLAAFLVLTGLVGGGLSTSSNALVGLSVDQGQQGIAYGLSQSASSLGGALGPLIGGSLAAAVGLRPIFGMTAGLYILVGFIAMRLLSQRPWEVKP